MMLTLKYILTHALNLVAKNNGCFTLCLMFGALKKLESPSKELSIDSLLLDFFLLSRFTNCLSRLSGEKGSMNELSF